jgi:hypothetical protein
VSLLTVDVDGGRNGVVDGGRLSGGGVGRVKAMVEECREYIALESAPIVPLSATGKVLATTSASPLPLLCLSLH